MRRYDCLKSLNAEERITTLLSQSKNVALSFAKMAHDFFVRGDTATAHRQIINAKDAREAARRNLVEARLTPEQKRGIGAGLDLILR
jgi:hypothetical protein